MSQKLEIVLYSCSKGDEIICTKTTTLSNKWFTVGKTYEVLDDEDGDTYVLDEYRNMRFSSGAEFEKMILIKRSGQSLHTFKALYGSDTKAKVEQKPSSIVDGDYSQYCTWDVTDKQTKTSEWVPDTIRDDIDIMESIRHACNRN